MGGGIAQLAAFGAADQYLSAQPQITYFKQIWRRYTQFAMEGIEQSWTGDVDFGKKCTINLSRAGDLVTEVWLQIALPDLSTLNHITAASRRSDMAVIYKARNTSAQSLQIDAYPCTLTTTTKYAVYLRSGAAYQGGNASISEAGVLTLTFSVDPGTVTLAPLGATGSPIIMTTGDSPTVRTATLLANTAYAMRIGTDVTSKNHIFMLVAPLEASQNLTFAVAGVDPSLTYQARVLNTNNALFGEVHVLKAKWCNSVGHALVSSVEWELGGSRIDRHTGEHYDMWCEVSESEEKRKGYSEMIGRYDAYDINDDSASFSKAKVLFVPLRFSFNTSAGSALPLLALQFHDCKLNFEFRPFMELIKTNVEISGVLQEPGMDCKVFATYVFLSQEERMRFAQMPHEYLIEQVQAQVENVAAASSSNGTLTRKFTLAFNHPIKELMFVYHASDNLVKSPLNGNNWFDYDIPEFADEELFGQANIQMNGHDRFVKRPAKYWRLVVPWSHHSRCPTKKVHCYSFALHPESWQNPSGAANFSRIDSAQLYVEFNSNIKAGRIRIHALGYNVLRIANGLAGLAFAN